MLSYCRHRASGSASPADPQGRTRSCGLVKSFVMTPAKLAANRRNARKSAGPRTRVGKHRAAVNGRTRSLCPKPRAKRGAKPTKAKPVKTIRMNKIRIKEKKRSHACYHPLYQGLTEILRRKSVKYGWIGSVLLRIRDRRACGSKPTGSEANRSQAS